MSIAALGITAQVIGWFILFLRGWVFIRAVIDTIVDTDLAWYYKPVQWIPWRNLIYFLTDGVFSVLSMSFGVLLMGGSAAGGTLAGVLNLMASILVFGVPHYYHRAQKRYL